MSFKDIKHAFAFMTSK